MNEYRHEKYTWQKPFGTVRHNWELVGHDGALNFWMSKTEGYPWSGGLEFHHLSGDGAPDHVNCPLTGGRCWHDGTSLYAMETLWPQIEPMLRHGDHEGIFSVLEMEATEHFKRSSP